MHFESRKEIILNLGFRESGMDQLKAYVDLLWTANKDLNLVSRKMEFSELIDNHVIDCLLPVKKFPQGLSRVADLGSGGGLPGVIWAIQFPEIQFQLFEKSPLKQEFLNSCKKIAPNLEILGEISSDLKNVDLVTARGFKAIDVILDVTRIYFLKNGKYFLLKGRLEKINEELLLAKKKFKNLAIKTEQVFSPVLEVERHIVRIN